MTVLLTISKTASGAEVSDVLAGTSNFGLDLGQVANGSYTPLVGGTQALNQGRQDIYISHNGVVDPVTDVSFYLAQFSGSYGGPDAHGAAYDLSDSTNGVFAMGAADSGTTANNTDAGGGLSSGLHMDMSWNVAEASQFLPSREASGQKRIFGKTYTGKDGKLPETSFPLHVDAMSYWNGTTEIDATAPVTGKIGKSSDAALGNRAHVRLRWYLKSTQNEGGIAQVDWVTVYSFTA